MKSFKQLTHILIFGLLTLDTPLRSQDKADLPTVGRVIPSFELNHITHYKSKTATDKDFRGKWLILDFWTLSCKGCIASFPKVSALTTQFRDHLNWVMVGLKSTRNPGIEEKFEKLRKTQDLTMASAYDTALFRHWDVNVVPHLIIVDPNGMVRYITTGRDLTSEKMAAILRGESTKLNQKLEAMPRFDSEDPLVNTVYKSLLTRWNGEYTEIGYRLDRFVAEPVTNKGWRAIMAPLYFLYDYAYFGDSYFDPDEQEYGQYWRHPVLEMEDQTPFESEIVGGIGEGLYNYTLKVPIESMTTEKVMEIMQHDLKTAFGYDVTVETRDISAIKLVASSGAKEKLATKGGAKFITKENTVTGFKMENYPVKDLLIYLKIFIDKDVSQFVDETGVEGNIDFEIDADMTDLEAIRKGIKNYGLDLVPGTHKMKVLVIRDKKKS